MLAMLDQGVAGAAGPLSVRACSEQFQRIDVDPAGDALDALQCQVALASLHAAHVGPMDSEHVGERLLA